MSDQIGQGEIYDLIDRFRRELLRKERAAATAMVQAYGQAWQKIKAELERLDREYEAAKAKGERPDWNWIYQFNRLRAFRDQVEGELRRFAEYAEETVQEEQRDAIQAAQEQARQFVEKAMRSARLEAAWNQMDPKAIETMVGLTQNGPLHRLFLGISESGAREAEAALAEGMLLGQNPRAVAREIRKALGLSLTRPLTIARTETLRAHREATRFSYQANSDIVSGWTWHSATDDRTCAACWAMHGTEHKLDERLDDHPNGRCAMVPILKGVEFKVKPGAEIFAGLRIEQQIKILGPAKWAAWMEGKLTLDEDVQTGIVGRSFSSIWGSMRYERSLVAILGKDGAKGYYPTSGRRTGGFTWFKGGLPDVEAAIQQGKSAQGWVYHEKILRRDYLPRFNLIDDVEYTLGLWGSPEPSFNAHVSGKVADVMAFARTWGKDYNQEAMAILLPTQGGLGGKLSWDFGRKLKVEELDILLGSLKQVNDRLAQLPNAPLGMIGLTVKDYQTVEFWVGNDLERAAGEDFIQQAIGLANIKPPISKWEGGYRTIFLSHEGGNY